MEMSRYVAVFIVAIYDMHTVLECRNAVSKNDVLKLRSVNQIYLFSHYKIGGWVEVLLPKWLASPSPIHKKSEPIHLTDNKYTIYFYPAPFSGGAWLYLKHRFFLDTNHHLVD